MPQHPRKAKKVLFLALLQLNSLSIGAWLHGHRRTPALRLRVAASKNDGREGASFLFSGGAQHETELRYPEGEVVGATGKIGSYILSRLNEPLSPGDAMRRGEFPQSLNAAAVPRGLSPGCLSPAGTPIYVCVPSAALYSVWVATAPHRRRDIVFLCNCIPSRHLAFVSGSDDVTVGILHFGISFGDSSDERPNPRLNTSPVSPETILHGRHALAVAKLLEDDGIPVKVASEWSEVQIAAAKKIAWSSLMWLLCHECSDPIPVKEVHATKAGLLKQLVEEIYPALTILANKSGTGEGASMDTVAEIMDYLESYSMSINGGNVVPSKRLALDELHERNGLLLSLLSDEDQGLHSTLLRQVAGQNYDELGAREKATRHDPLPIKLSSSNLTFLFTQQQPGEECAPVAKTAVVVGAGMIGSSIAYHLAKEQGMNVTVLDQRTNLLPTRDEETVDPGTATSSSFSWLNSNDKRPMSYGQLNSLGMEVWRRHDLLKDFPNWCGSLKRTKDLVRADPYYSCIGPLTREDASRIERGVDWNMTLDDEDARYFFYPEEGHVDPMTSVKRMRIAARDLGVTFIEGADITKLLRSSLGIVSGLQYSKGDNLHAQILVDRVVIAAGANSCDPLLGLGENKLPMLYQPGHLAFARTTVDEGSTKTLERMFIDTLSECHILRRGEEIVVGGGQLVFGGDEDISLKSGGDDKILDATDFGMKQASCMIETAAKQIAPFDLLSYKVQGCTGANRPMPADGLPVIGYAEPGLYVAVMHSGMTLGLLAGELAAYEIGKSQASEGNGFDILGEYRPSRFN